MLVILRRVETALVCRILRVPETKVKTGDQERLAMYMCPNWEMSEWPSRRVLAAKGLHGCAPLRCCLTGAVLSHRCGGQELYDGELLRQVETGVQIRGRRGGGQRLLQLRPLDRNVQGYLCGESPPRRAQTFCQQRPERARPARQAILRHRRVNDVRHADAIRNPLALATAAGRVRSTQAHAVPRVQGPAPAHPAGCNTPGPPHERPPMDDGSGQDRQAEAG